MTRQTGRFERRGGIPAAPGLAMLAGLMLTGLGGCGSVSALNPFGPGDDALPANRVPVSQVQPRQVQGGGGMRMLRCASTNGNYAFCPGDTSTGVQLFQQRSETPCVINQSWGFDSRGIWVDRGCAADFQLGNAAQAFQQPAQPAQPTALAPMSPPPQPQAPAAPEPAPVQPPQPAIAGAATGGLNNVRREPSYQFGSQAEDAAVRVCKTYANEKARSFDAESAHIDRVLRVSALSSRIMEVQAYVRLNWSDRIRRKARKLDIDINDVIFVKCQVRENQVLEFKFNKPV